MRDLDQLVSALREQADGLEPVVLLPGVRRGARRVRRRRQIAAMTAVVVVVAGVVGGTALISRGHGSRSAPAGPSPAATASALATATARPGLTGHTWHVVSWEVSGKRGAPATTVPPTLTFLPPNGTTGKSQVSVFDGGRTTSMTVVVSPGPQLVAWGTGFSASPATAAAVRDVDRVFATVLAGNGGVELDPDRLTLTYRDSSITLVSTPPPVGATVDDLLHKSWYLSSVDGNGRIWSPGAVSTLIFTTGSTAETDDGANVTSWVVTLDPHQVSWVPGESTGVGEGAVAFQLGSVESSVFKGRTDWSINDGRLVFTGSNGTSLTYTTTKPPEPKPYSGALIFLDDNPAGGQVAAGQPLNLISGDVTITDAQSKIAWSGQVTADDGGDSKLPPGPYTVTAVVPGGTCAPLPVTIKAQAVGEFTLVCTTTQPTATQPTATAAAQHG